ncbi:MAG: phenylalanine--tRNA ligase subunit beta, partial [Planctomycetota bacterium]
MKVSYNWLQDYCAFQLSAHQLAERLSQRAFNVESYAPHGDDHVLDVEVTTDRPDCLCHLGLAREVAAITGGRARAPEVELVEAADQAIAERVRVEVTAPDLCPHYTARVLEGVEVGPSPEWMQRRLSACGLRPVNNVVDITNYVMLECGQPLHAFDLSLIGDAHTVVRRSRAGEVMTTIDGAELELTGQECVIADHFRPIALAGVMGGLDSEISDSTTAILLESARFDPRSNRHTSRRHGIGSESSYRYQRGIDPEVTDWASRRACELILELAGGTLLKGSADLRADSTLTPELVLRLARLKLVLGLEVPRSEIVRIFKGLQLLVLHVDDEAVRVRVPSWRGDLRREIDLIEEVARIYGYDKIGETTEMPVRAVSLSAQEQAERRVRRLLAGCGFHEVMTYSLVSTSPIQLAQPWGARDPIAVRNPVTVDRT